MKSIKKIELNYHGCDLQYYYCNTNAIGTNGEINFNVNSSYYTYKDHLSSIVTLTNDEGEVVHEQSFDAWGRRRNPHTWLYEDIPEVPTWLRGYTGHEHLPEFNLINMNGRMYDPILGRMLRPDNFVQNPYNSQSYNRYSYVWNNPLKYTDPSGEFIVLDSWIVGFVDGFFSTSNNRFSAGWNEANHRAGNDAKIWGGLFVSDPNKNFWGRSWETISRFTWQAPQTVLGFLYNQSVNTFTSRVDDVQYFHGATFVVGATRGGNAVSLGSYISISPVNEDDQANIRIGQDGYTTMHEYGHYLQSQKSGPLYLFKYGIPSALGDADWTEHDANLRAANYFQRVDPTFTWIETPSRYRTLAKEVHNPRWFEYPLFLTGIGNVLIVSKNWSKPW
jgi:RHS repeat-associated protein